MAINPLIASALSITQILAPFSRGLSSASFAPPNDPTAQINAIDGLSAAQSNFLQYPLDRPKYYALFDIFQYSRDSLMTLGTLNPAAGYPSIVLPMPMQIIDNHMANWTDKAEVGVLAGEALNNIKPIIASSGVTGAIGAVGLTGAAQAVLSDLKNPLPSGTIPGLSALFGLSPNQFLTVLYAGPMYKRYQFQWNFSPHNKQEADILRQITKTFNNAMSPNFTLGGGIWTFPKIIWVSLFPNSKFLMKLKPCVMTAFTTNFSPGGKPSFYHDADASGAGNAPEGITVNMQLLSLEYWIEGNFGDSNDPHDVYNHTPVTFNPATQGVIDFLNTNLGLSNLTPSAATNPPDTLTGANAP